MSKIKLKRAYDPPSKADGQRILVERLWPRGLKKASAKIDLWIKEIAPTKELRQWYGHEIDKWPEFRTKYRTELKANKAVVSQLLQRLKGASATFIYAASDTEHNSAVVLKEFIEAFGKGPRLAGA